VSVKTNIAARNILFQKANGKKKIFQQFVPNPGKEGTPKKETHLNESISDENTSKNNGTLLSCQ
jgi:hypothetical protein